MAEVLGKEINIGGSIFWILLVFLSLTWLSYLGIWSFQNNSIKGVVISTIFFAMIISGIVLSKFEIFNTGNWRENALSFSAGFGLWALISGSFGTQSLLSVSQNHLFASISGELPQFIDVLMNGIVVPIAEEIFWMFAIPYALISIMNSLGKKYSFFENHYLQLIIVAIIAGLSFAFFHVGKTAFTYFVISAIIFRVIMIFAIFGDKKLDWLKKFNLVSAFAVGGHIANNIFNGGIRTAIIVLQQDPIVFIIICTFFIIVFGSAIYHLIMLILGKEDKKLI